MGKEHWVVCQICGTKFDASKEGSHYDGNRYTCPCFKEAVCPFVMGMPHKAT